MKFFAEDEARVFVNGILVDTAVTLDYMSHQQKMPLFGYKSQTWDAIAIGKFFVHGSFTISWHSPAHILRLLAVNNYTVPEHMVDEITLHTGDEFGITQYKTFEDQLQAMHAQNPAGFREVSDVLKHSMWDISQSDSSERLFRTDLHDDNMGRGFLRDDSPLDRPSHFEIMIRYSATRYFEQFTEARITNVAKVLNPDGNPVLEKYDFIAKGFNEGVLYEPDEDSARDIVSSSDAFDPICAPIDPVPGGEPAGELAEVPPVDITTPITDQGDPIAPPAEPKDMSQEQRDEQKDKIWGEAPTAEPVLPPEPQTSIIAAGISLYNRGYNGHDLVSVEAGKVFYFEALKDSVKEWESTPDHMNVRGTYLEDKSPFMTYLREKTNNFSDFVNAIIEQPQADWTVSMNLLLHGKDDVQNFIIYTFDSYKQLGDGQAWIAQPFGRTEVHDRA